MEDPNTKSLLPLRRNSLNGIGFADLPLLLVVLMLNVLPSLLKKYNIANWSSSQAIVVALIGGITVACLMNVHQLKVLLPAVNEGANGSLPAIMNTACAVGFDPFGSFNCKHKESYLDICVTSCIIPVVVSLAPSFVWGFLFFT